MKVNILFPAIVVTLSLVLVQGVHADDDDKRIRELQRSGQILSLAKIFDAARSVKQGRILDTDLDEDDGQIIYEIELLDARGRVWEMEFDARTGELIKLEQDD